MLNCRFGQPGAGLRFDIPEGFERPQASPDRIGDAAPAPGSGRSRGAQGEVPPTARPVLVPVICTPRISRSCRPGRQQTFIPHAQAGHTPSGCRSKPR